MELISPNIKIDFISKRYLAFFISIVVCGLSIYTWVDQGVGKYGIDYVGGHEIVIEFNEKTSSDKIRSSLSRANIEGAIVQAFEEEKNDYSIRIAGSAEDSKDVIGDIRAALEKDYSSGFEVIKTDFVGPTIGAELKKKALTALIVGLLGILGYITYRFEFAFALGAVVALFHDVIVCVGVYLFSGLTLNMATLAAALTIVGYSVNDTIIIFDRMREEIIRRKSFVLRDLMNYSINATLSRTIITSLLTLFSAAALLVFGGGAIRDLSLFLVVGVITGTYSTIFIASPIALMWEELRNK